MPRAKKSTGAKPKSKKEFVPHIAPEFAHPCDVPGCAQPGVYKAPKSRDELHEYRWFCLEHIRQHNEKWDFFAGLERDEIEDFIKDAVTGHRPTWDRATLNQEGRVSDRYNKLQDALYEFLATGKKAPPPTPPIKARLRKALAVMELDYPYSETSLKKKYRTMVKKYHPDANKGDKRSEETFKQIAVAYHALLEHLKKPD